MTIRVSGLKELEDALKELGSEVAGSSGKGKTNLVREAMMKAMEPVKTQAKETAPFSGPLDDDGIHLRDTIRKRRQTEPDPDIAANEVIDVGLFKGGKGKRIFYGQFLEFGTSQMPAQPWLRQSLEANRGQVLKLFRKNLATGVIRVAKRVGNKNVAAVGARIKKL